MAVYLSMRQVREELLQHEPSGNTIATGGCTHPMLGAFFREVFGELIGSDTRWNWASVLLDQDPDQAKWRESLVDHCYRRLVAYRLERYQYDLQDAAAEVCAFWWGVQALCEWVVERLWNAYLATGQLLEAHTAVKCDLPLEIELKEAGWTDTVRLTDIDATVWRPPGSQSWYVVELGGDAMEEGHTQSIGQACLHYLLMRSAGESHYDGQGTLSLVSFLPERHEQTFPMARLEVTLKQLKARIGQAAGVIPSWLKTVQEVRTARELPRPYDQISNTLLDTLREYGAPVSMVGPPQVGHNSLRFTLIPGEGVQVAKIKQLADALRLRLRLRTAPLIDASGSEISISIERGNRPIVFYWPT